MRISKKTLSRLINEVINESFDFDLFGLGRSNKITKKTTNIEPYSDAESEIYPDGGYKILKRYRKFFPSFEGVDSEFAKMLIDDGIVEKNSEEYNILLKTYLGGTGSGEIEANMKGKPKERSIMGAGRLMFENKRKR